MRKLIFYFTAIVLILTLGSIGFTQGLPSLTESSPVPPSSPPTTTVIPPVMPASSPNIYSFTDSTCSFSFNFPDNWKEFEEAEEVIGTLKAELGFWEGDYLLACFYVFVNDTDLSLSQYSMQEEEWMMNPQNMADYRKISEEAINIGSFPAIQRLYTYTFITNDNSKIPLKAIDVYIVNNNKSYMLVGEVDQDKFDRMLADLAIMFNSFVITEELVSVSTIPELPPVTISDTSSITPVTPTAPTGNETVFKFCPYCGAPLQSNFKFCPGCGEPIPVQRVTKVPKEEETRCDRRNNIDYSVNPLQTRGFSEEINRLDQIKGINKSINKPLNAFQPSLISQGFGIKLVRIFPNKPLLPWVVSRRIISDHYNYSGLIPGTIGRKISSQILTTRSSYPENLNFSYIKELDKQITFNPNLRITYRGGGIHQLGSFLKNLGKDINTKMVVSQAPSLEKTWVLRSVRRGAEEDISMGSSIKRLESKIGTSLVDQARSFSFGECFSNLGQGITYETGVKREAETLPSLTSPSTQTTPTLPTIPSFTGPEGIVILTPEAPAQGGITLTPPGQPTPAQPGPGGIALPTPGTPQESQIIWKQYSLNQAFGRNPLITGYLEYPSTWMVNLDSFNRNVTFSEDASSGLTSFTLFPGLMGQFSSAQDLAQQMAYMLQQQVPDLSILNQEFKIVPTPGAGAIEVTEGKINLQGSYQGTTFRFNLETYVLYTGAYGLAPGMSGTGYVILTQASQNIFTEKEQKYFNRMILSYKRALGVVK